MANYSSLYRRIRRKVPGCPDAVILGACQEVAREFCRETWFARHQIEVPIAAGQGDYTLDAPDTFTEEVIGVKAAVYKGYPLQPASPEEAPQQPGSPAVGMPGCFLFFPPDTFSINPVPPVGTDLGDEPIYVTIIVQPVEDATVYPDSVAREFDYAIADGAIAWLAGSEGAAWSSPKLAAEHEMKFRTAKMNAKGKAARAHMPWGTAVAPRRFL